MNSIECVTHTINRKPGTPLAKGELAVDKQFALDFLSWHFKGRSFESLPDTDLLTLFCHILKLDIVCIPAQNPSPGKTAFSIQPEQVRSIVDEGLFVFWLVNGSFQTLMTRSEPMALFMDVARSPESVCRMLQEVTAQVITDIKVGVDAGAHGIIIADDIAYRQGTYISPVFIENEMLPIWRVQVTAAKKLDVPVFFHSDGNLNAVLSPIATSGFDGLQCIEPAAGMDIRQVKLRYGDDLCLMGNLDPALLYDPAAEVDKTDPDYSRLGQAVEQLIASAGRDGGFIFGTCSGLQTGMSPARVDSMYRLASKLDPAAA